MRKPLKLSEFLRREFYRSQKQLKVVTFKGVFVTGVQLNRHNFGQWQSFRGLVDSPRIEGCAYHE